MGDDKPELVENFDLKNTYIKTLHSYVQKRDLCPIDSLDKADIAIAAVLMGRTDLLSDLVYRSHRVVCAIEIDKTLSAYRIAWSLRGDTQMFRLPQTTEHGPTYNLVVRWLWCMRLFQDAVFYPFDGEVQIELGDGCGGVEALSFSHIDALRLLPDCYFLNSAGYSGARRVFAKDRIAWAARSDNVFWRGATTGRQLTSFPRVDLCRLAQTTVGFDCGLVGLVHLTAQEAVDIEAEGLVRPRASELDLDAHKYHIDIDGNSNSWPGLFLKLLSGGLVFKVESPAGWRQWYYDELQDGYNYISIKSDLSNLLDKVEYYRRRNDEAYLIAQRGKMLAMSKDLYSELEFCRPRIAANSY